MYLHSNPTNCITSLDKLNLAWWFCIKPEPLLANDITSPQFFIKSGQKPPKNNHLTTFTKMHLVLYKCYEVII